MRAMSSVKQVLQSPTFNKAVKKLHQNQKNDLDKAVKQLIAKPDLGEKKKGDLSYLRVYKFKMVKQEVLLGYSYIEDELVLELLALGSHENFYRDMK